MCYFKAWTTLSHTMISTIWKAQDAIALLKGWIKTVTVNIHQRHALSLKTSKNCIICQSCSWPAVRMTAPWLIWKACSKTAAHYKSSGSGFLWREAAGSLGVTEGRVSHYELQLVTTALCEITVIWNEFIFTEKLKRRTKNSIKLVL